MSEGNESGRRICLIDGAGFVFRAFHALPPLSRGDGTPTNAVLGFCNTVFRLAREREWDAVAVLFDTARKTFRNDIYEAYKANRPPPPEALIPQFPLVREATRAFGLPAIEAPGYEADDLIATYARLAVAAGDSVTVVSSDKDLMQLVGERVAMLDPVRMRPIGRGEVIAKFGVPPEKAIDVQALAGDSTDNVPGVPGIGVKTAAQLIEAYGDLDTLLARAGEIKQPKRRQTLLDHADLARVSRELVTLRTDAPIPVPLESFGPLDPERETLEAFLVANEFYSLLARIRAEFGWEGGDPRGAVPAEPAPEPAERRYALVRTLDELKAWVARAQEAGRVAVDTETTGLDAMSAELVGVSLAVAPGDACYVPLAHRAPGGVLDSEVGPQIPSADALGALKPLLEDPATMKVGQNVKYDMLVFARRGIRVAPIDDTMLMSFALAAGLRGHGMDELSRQHLGIEPIPIKSLIGKGKAQITFDLVPVEGARDYAAEDADITLRLDRALKPLLVRERVTRVYETLERPLAPVLAAMERRGVRVDRVALAGLSRDFGKRLSALEREIYDLAGREFAIASPKQLGAVLFDEMGLPGGKKGKTGAYATGADVLEALAAQDHALPARVLDWRRIAKLKSTYSDALTESIDKRTGRVHTSYSMAGAATGRLSSTDPNLQNIPVRTEEGRKIRGAFVPDEGFLLMSADYSQIELRLLAHVADVGPLRDAFRGGADVHAATAAQVFGVPAEGMDPLLRRRAKAINFGIIYGISAFGLARQLRIERREAQTWIDAWFERYPGIRGYMERAKAFARANGYVETIFGRRCHIRGIAERNPARRHAAERQAINAPLQGSAADIVKRAMIRVQPALDAAGLSARMLLQVHDELVFEVPQYELEETAAVVRRVMERATLPALELAVPLAVDTGWGSDWEVAH